MGRSAYNASQWRWVAERYMEGYPVGVLARALYMSRTSVMSKIRSMGYHVQIWSRREPEPPLADLMHEFYTLGMKGGRDG